MAIRACNNPKITSCALSRVLSDLVLSTAKNEIERIRQQARAAEAAEQQEAVRSLLTLASNSPEGDDGDEGAAARTVSPALSSTSPSVDSPAKHVQTFLDLRFRTPYLKGRATHFQRKVASKIEALTRDQPPPQPQPVQKKAKTLRTRKTSGQKNIGWRNDIIYADDTGVRYANARKEATQLFVDIKAGRVVDGRTQKQIIDDLNQKYGLDGAGRDGNREKHMLSVRTVQHLVMKGEIGSSPVKRGNKPAISRNLMKLIALHVSMEQVGDSGELSTAQIKATISATMMDTVHDEDHNLEYIWQEIRRLHADILVPTGMISTEDSRWQFVTHEKMNIFYNDYGVSVMNIISQNTIAPLLIMFPLRCQANLLKYGFMLPEPEILDDGTVCEFTPNPLLKSRQIVYDESELRMGTEKDSSGSRSKTHTNPNLNRGGSRHTRSSFHITGGMAVTGGGEMVPPLIIFSSSAEKEENLAVQDGWVASFGKTKGKYGHRRPIERMPYIAVRKSGSIDGRLFREYVETVTFDLYPRETVSLEIKVDDHGRLVSGPVIWTCDTGQGRLACLDDERWDEWALELREHGIILHGLLPNSTAVSAVMDELFRAFKIAFRKATLKHFARKIKTQAQMIRRRKLEIAKRIANGEAVSAADQDKAKVKSIVSLNASDLGPILYGELTDDGFAADGSPIATCFTKEKIMAAHKKVCIAGARDAL